MTLSLEKCREILGSEAESMTDSQVEEIRDHYTKLADVMYDAFRDEARRNPEFVRWMAYFQHTGEAE